MHADTRLLLCPVSLSRGGVSPNALPRLSHLSMPSLPSHEAHLSLFTEKNWLPHISWSSVSSVSLQIVFWVSLHDIFHLRGQQFFRRERKDAESYNFSCMQLFTCSLRSGAALCIFFCLFCCIPKKTWNNVKSSISKIWQPFSGVTHCAKLFFSSLTCNSLRCKKLRRETNISDSFPSLSSIYRHVAWIYSYKA